MYGQLPPGVSPQPAHGSWKGTMGKTGMGSLGNVIPLRAKLLQFLLGRRLLLVLGVTSSPTYISWCSVRLNPKPCCDFNSFPSVCTRSVPLLGKHPLLGTLSADGLPAACHIHLCLCPLAVGELGVCESSTSGPQGGSCLG